MNTSITNSQIFDNAMQKWLAFHRGDARDLFYLKFHDQLIGNPLIRSVHGGATASLIELSAQLVLADELGEQVVIKLASSSVDYLRATSDVDIHSRALIVRITRRLAFVDVWCWQDDEDVPVARGTCTLRLTRTT